LGGEQLRVAGQGDGAARGDEGAGLLQRQRQAVQGPGQGGRRRLGLGAALVGTGQQKPSRVRRIQDLYR
jgi:hypothetical protein